MSEQKSRSRHLIDQEIISAIDLIPTTDFCDTTLMESRINQSKMLPSIDVTQLFPATFEERAVGRERSEKGDVCLSSAEAQGASNLFFFPNLLLLTTLHCQNIKCNLYSFAFKKYD